jgi:hypothetical protein
LERAEAVSISTRRSHTGGYKLPSMMVRRRVITALASALSFAIGCKERRNMSVADTTAAPAPVQGPPSQPRVNPGWDSTAGPALFLAMSDSPHAALVVLPALTDSAIAATRYFDISQLSGLQTDLFARKGRAGSGSIVASAQSGVREGCPSWPTAQISGATTTDWRIALEKGRANGIRLDSLEGLASADSAELAKQIIAAASSIRTRSDSVFADIPFAVRHAYRFALGRSSVVFSNVVRKINEEANPREERLVLVLERLPGGAYNVAYQSRSAGPEEELQTTELLAAVLFASGNHPGMFISSEYEDGGKIVLLERTGDMQWRSVWRSAYTGC